LGSKRFDIQVVEKLKEIRLAGNIEKSNKISPENMLSEPKICVTFPQIKSLITYLINVMKNVQLKMPN
jgi:hypothetical protein